MNKTNINQSQSIEYSNLFYDFFRLCNAQEYCIDCPIYDVVEAYYRGIKEKNGEKTSSISFLDDLAFEWHMDFCEEQRAHSSCLKNLPKKVLDEIGEIINSWSDSNSESYLKDIYFKEHENRKNIKSYPNQCPCKCGYINDKGKLSDKAKEINWYSCNEVMFPVNCDSQVVEYDSKHWRCQKCWNTPLRYEE